MRHGIKSPQDSGKSLDASGTANNSAVIQYDYWGGANQQWELVPVN